MKKNGKLNLPPNHPKVIAAVLADLRAMSPAELQAMLERRPEGVEETNMNEELAEWYREQAKKREAEIADMEPARAKVA